MQNLNITLYIEPFVMFKFSQRRLSWFSTLYFFMGAQNFKLCRVSADAKKNQNIRGLLLNFLTSLGLIDYD